MGESSTLALLLLLKKSLDVFIKKGIAIYAAAVVKEGKLHVKHKVGPYDENYDPTLKGIKNEKTQREGQRLSKTETTR